MICMAPRKKREKLTEPFLLNIEPSRLAAWRTAADALGLPLAAWIRLRVDGLLAPATGAKEAA